MTTRTAVILARGLGSRMRAAQAIELSPEQKLAAQQGAKAMMPFGRPFLDYSLSNLADAGITDAILVIGPEHQAVKDYFVRTEAGRRIRIRFAIQEAPLGTADAVWAARDQVGKAPFLVLNGDNLYPTGAIRALTGAPTAGLVAFTAHSLIHGSGLPAERLLKFALLDISNTMELVDIHEKPSSDHPLLQRPEHFVSMNLWQFTASILPACQAISPSIRGELELQDAVRTDIRAHGTRYRCVISEEPVIDLSSRSDIHHVAARLAALTPVP